MSARRQIVEDRQELRAGKDGPVIVWLGEDEYELTTHVYAALAWGREHAERLATLADHPEER